MILALGVAVAGGLGAACRYAVDTLARRWWPVPWPTLLTGFCGGYTTFSTAAHELRELRQRRAWRAYAIGSLLLPVLAAAAGLAIGHAIGGHA